jgi:hypothetical protein
LENAVLRFRASDVAERVDGVDAFPFVEACQQ